MSERRIIWLARLLGVLIAAVLLLAVWTTHVSHESCRRVANIDKVIQQQGQRGLRTLGRKGGVGYAYYQAHPAELVVARRQLVAQIAEFKPTSCSGIF